MKGLGTMAGRAARAAAGEGTETRSRTARDVFARILVYLKRHPWLATGTMGCAILSTWMALAYPKLTGLIVDQVLGQHHSDLLLPYVAAVAGAFLLRDLLNAIRIRLNNTFEQKVIYDIRCDLYRKLQDLSVGYFDQRATGDIMTRVIEDVTSVERVLIDGTEQGSVAALQIAAVACMMCLYSVKLTLVAMIPVPILLTGAWLYTSTAHHRYRLQRRATSAMNALLNDSIQGMRQIKLFTREEQEFEKFSCRASQLQESNLRVMRIWSIYSPGMAAAAAMGTVLILYFGGGMVLRGESTLGALVGFLGYMAMFYDPIGRLHNLNQMFQAGRAAGERVFDILDAPDEGGAAGKFHLPMRVRGHVLFENIHFEYASNLPVLHDINFHIEPGQMVALVGPTGAGKSTILNLLPRFYSPSRGCIRMDGVNIAETPLPELRSQFGIVSQEPFLFNDTVRENLLFGRPGAAEKEMIEAAHAANAHDFIRKLPQGYDSRVGERGVKLSVGEKQRISIARAILRDPPMLLLDEATASVDTATERQIQDALLKLMQGRTSLVIAHRLSTVRHADIILVLEHGRIIERGSHLELMAAGGLYASLCRIQFAPTGEGMGNVKTLSPSS